jgi:hypothetical protein
MCWLPDAGSASMPTTASLVNVGCDDYKHDVSLKSSQADIVETGR